MGKKILFISPGQPDKQLGKVSFFGKLPSLAGHQLKKLTPESWDFYIADENIHPWERDLYRFRNPGLVAITSFASNFVRALKLADYWKGRGKPVVMGGHQVTGVPEIALKHATAIVSGEAEDIWGHVIYDAELGRRGDKRAYKSKKFPDLENVSYEREVPMPTFHLGGKKSGFTWTKRGCPLGCDFCGVSPFSGRLIRHRPAKEVYEEVKKALPKGGILILADDNVVAGKREKVLELFETLKSLKIRWLGQSDIRIATDEEYLRKAVESGLLGVLIGFESPDSSLLAGEVGKAKAFWSSDYERGIKALHENKVIIEGTFPIGFDGQTEEMVREMYRWTVEQGLEVVQLTIVTPLPNTPLIRRWQGAGRVGSLDKINWDEVNFSRMIQNPLPGGMDAHQARKLLEEGYDYIYSKENTKKRLQGKDFGTWSDNVLKIVNWQFGRALK